ncbi:hypothetical protein ACLOAU_04620 [Niabella sp. CJ426]|uniref:hypothetical protein n=1 Tax=Niabella sp. CJ426 TaxID=3393740 RepID=UPI003D05E3EC
MIKPSTHTLDIGIKKFKSPVKVKEITITPEFNWLNKLKKSNPEAFFYWEKAIALKN